MEMRIDANILSDTWYKFKRTLTPGKERNTHRPANTGSGATTDHYTAIIITMTDHATTIDRATMQVKFNP